MKIENGTPPSIPAMAARPGAPGGPTFGAVLEAKASLAGDGQRAFGFGEFGMMGRFDAVESAAFPISSSPAPTSHDPQPPAVETDGSGGAAIAEGPEAQGARLPTAVLAPASVRVANIAPRLTPALAPDSAAAGSVQLATASPSEEDVETLPVRRTVHPNKEERSAASPATLTLVEGEAGLKVIAAAPMLTAEKTRLNRGMDQIAGEFGLALTEISLNGTVLKPQAVSQFGVPNGNRTR